MKLSDYESRTNSRSTETADGNIPHLEFRGCYCPVKLLKRKNTKNLHYIQKTTDGFPVYVIPGGTLVTLDPKGFPDD